jgi:carbamoyltransferase
MNILGIGFTGYHDSAVALIKDQAITFACAEERLSRLKHDPRFPFESIARALQYGQLDAGDIDYVAIGMGRPGSAALHTLRLLLSGRMTPSYSRLEGAAIGLIKDLRDRSGYRSYKRRYPGAKRGVKFVDHHFAHALSAFCLSGFSESAVMVIDGRGAREATTLWHAKDGVLTNLEQYDFPDSLGVFYATITGWLGFTPMSDEWKVMGLASYGEPNVDLSRLIKITDDGYTVNGKLLVGPGDDRNVELEKIIGPRRSGDLITQRHKDLACSAQAACEKAMHSLLRRVTSLTRSRNICLAGGVALNCKANGELARSGLVDNIYIQPAAGDDGVAIGAALGAFHQLGEPIPCNALGHSYLGTQYDNDEIERALRVYKLHHARLADVPKATARLLAEDRLIGWFQGRMEFGPRALGCRSILADPRNLANRDRVNEAVKFREDWRPFAPSVLEEMGHLYFKDFRASPYMILSFWATEEARRRIPAVVHIDGSCRVQSVTRDVNPRYYDMLSEFAKITGVGACMNTSFNLKGDAIVESPRDAIQTFYTSGLDALVIGDFLVTK